MNPGSEDDGNKQEAVREEMMEIAFAVGMVTEGMVTTVVDMLECLEKGNSEADRVEIVATVTRVTDGMVTAVDMLECLEKEKPEFDRTTAVRFFSHALAEGDETGLLPLHSPGRLPGLVQLLADCMGSHPNEAMLSINRLIYHYAHILEPTETEMTNLEEAIKTIESYIRVPNIREHDCRPISQVLPAIIGLFQEPGNRQKTQAHAASCLAKLASWDSDGIQYLLIESGVMGMLMETVRVGKASPDVLGYAISAISGLIGKGGSMLTQSALDSGILEVIELVFKRPIQTSKLGSSWIRAMSCLLALCHWSQDQVLDAILSSGLMEHILEMGEWWVSEEIRYYYDDMLALLQNIVNGGQMRRLMSIGPIFRFLASHLKHLLALGDYGDYELGEWLDMVEACLAVPGTGHELRLRRRLIDDSGITDAIQRISRSKARHIFDTYLKNPLPPRPSSKLPLIIYTKNAPQ